MQGNPARSIDRWSAQLTNIVTLGITPAGKPWPLPRRASPMSIPNRKVSSSMGGNGLLEELVSKVAAVTSAKELRECWEMTGAGGMLSEEITHPGTGKRMPFQDYFTERGTELAPAGRLTRDQLIARAEELVRDNEKKAADAPNDDYENWVALQPTGFHPGKEEWLRLPWWLRRSPKVPVEAEDVGALLAPEGADEERRLTWIGYDIRGNYGDPEEVRQIITDTEARMITRDRGMHVGPGITLLTSSLTTHGYHAPILDLDYGAETDGGLLTLDRQPDSDAYIGMIAVLGKHGIISAEDAGHHVSYVYGRGDQCVDKIRLTLARDFQLTHSRTTGHHHLYLDTPMTWPDYVEFLTAMAKAGVIQEGYLNGTKYWGMSHLRTSLSKKCDCSGGSVKPF
jgi:hypothetical protein